MLLKGLLGIPSTGETRWGSNQGPFRSVWRSHCRTLRASSPRRSSLKCERTASARRTAESALCAESADLPSPRGRLTGQRCRAGGSHLQSLFKFTISSTASRASHRHRTPSPSAPHYLEDALTKQSLESARPSGGVCHQATERDRQTDRQRHRQTAGPEGMTRLWATFKSLAHFVAGPVWRDLNEVAAVCSEMPCQII